MKQTIRTHSERVPHSLTLARQTAITLFALMLTFFASPTTAWADSYNYIDADGTGKSHEAVPLTVSDTELTTGWYIVNEDVTINSRITVTGDVHIILMDGKSFTARRGITVNYNATANNALTIYAQSKGTGSLMSTSPYYAGIGGESGMTCGMVTINGGNITVNGGSRSAGIGGGGSDTSGDGTGGQSGTITINGGNISAKSGGNGAAAIGAAANAKAASLTDVIRLNWTNTGCRYVTQDGGYSSGRLMLIKPFNIESAGERATLNDLATATVIVPREGENLHSVTYKVDGNVFEQYYVVEGEKAENLQFYPAGKLFVWYEEDCSEPWNFELPIMNDLVLEATIINIVAYTTNPNGSIADCFIQDGNEINTDADALQAAFNNNPSGGKVWLAKDVDDFNYDYTNQLSVGNGKTVTLDLNGHNISSESNSTIYVDEGSLTVTGNGSINSSSRSAIDINNGEVNIENGTFTSGSSYAIYIFYGTLNISGGTFNSTATAYSTISIGEDVTANISGGSFSGISNAISNAGTLTISGGNFCATGDAENPGTAIKSYRPLTLKALPTFGSDNSYDICLIYYGPINLTFDTTIDEAPTNNIRLRIIDINYKDIPAERLPFTFTSGYNDYCSNIHPANIFQYGGVNNILITLDDNGEAQMIVGDRLFDNSDNTNTIEQWYTSGESHKVMLYGRTLYRNGVWNTLCLPFSMTAEQIAASDLAGAEIKELNATASNLANDGTLTLTFTPSSSIVAGKPYIVRWNNANPNIINPVFTNVIITATEPTPVTFSNAKGDDCQFVGQFSPFLISDGRNDENSNPTVDNINEILMMGSGSSLGYSQSTRTLKCFRAHFVIPTSGDKARSIVMNFDDEATGIKTTDFTDCTDADEWYTLDGRKLSGAPTTRGIYVRSTSGRSQGKNNGKKIIIK